MITKDSKILEVVQEYPQSLQVFQNHGLGCVGCMLAQFETLGEGAAAHGIDIDQLVIELNEAAQATPQA